MATFRIACDCGKSYSVAGADAGMILACECGDRIEVPSLHEMRSRSERPSESPLEAIGRLLMVGQLPGSTRCHCGRGGTGILHLNVVCERVPGENRSAPGDALVGLAFGWLFAQLLRSRRTEYGDEVSVLVPVPVCSACREGLQDEQGFKSAMKKIPIYAELLKYYPQAEITRRG